jgi:hypothetical protein
VAAVVDTGAGATFLLLRPHHDCGVVVLNEAFIALCFGCCDGGNWY